MSTENVTGLKLRFPQKHFCNWDVIFRDWVIQMLEDTFRELVVNGWISE